MQNASAAARLDAIAEAAHVSDGSPVFSLSMHHYDRSHARRTLLDGIQRFHRAANSRALTRASAAGTFTSGSTPTPSQFVFVIGLIARPFGTTATKRSSISCGATGCAPPPVVSPTMVARLRFLRLYENSSAPENVRCEVSTYTGCVVSFLPGTSSVVQNSSVWPVVRFQRSFRCVRFANR